MRNSERAREDGEANYAEAINMSWEWFLLIHIPPCGGGSNNIYESVSDLPGSDLHVHRQRESSRENIRSVQRTAIFRLGPWGCCAWTVAVFGLLFMFEDRTETWAGTGQLAGMSTRVWDNGQSRNGCRVRTDSTKGRPARLDNAR